MAHANQNFKTKKSLRLAVAAGEKVRPINPSGMFPVVENGTEYIEGPWEFHKWYAKVQVKDGYITKVIS